jgi:hypothetical protein
MAAAEAGRRDDRRPEPGADTDGPVVNYHFPVEVHALGSLPEPESVQLVTRAHDQLAWELASRQ